MFMFYIYYSIRIFFIFNSICVSFCVCGVHMEGAYEFRYLQWPEVAPLGATVMDSCKLPLNVKKPNTGFL